jgi:hypothetical protein
VEQPLWTRSADSTAALARSRVKPGRSCDRRGNRTPPKAGDAFRSSQKLSRFATDAELQLNKTLNLKDYYSLMFKGWLMPRCGAHFWRWFRDSAPDISPGRTKMPDQRFANFKAGIGAFEHGGEVWTSSRPESSRRPVV